MAPTKKHKETKSGVPHKATTTAGATTAKTKKNVGSGDKSSVKANDVAPIKLPVKAVGRILGFLGDAKGIPRANNNNKNNNISNDTRESDDCKRMGESFDRLGLKEA